MLHFFMHFTSQPQLQTWMSVDDGARGQAQDVVLDDACASQHNVVRCMSIVLQFSLGE